MLSRNSMILNHNRIQTNKKTIEVYKICSVKKERRMNKFSNNSNNQSHRLRVWKSVRKDYKLQKSYLKSRKLIREKKNLRSLSKRLIIKLIFINSFQKQIRKLNKKPKLRPKPMGHPPLRTLMISMKMIILKQIRDSRSIRI